MNIERKGGKVYLSGVINENSDFSPLLKETSPLKIDFSGVQRINSVGVRSWMKFLSQWGDDKLLEYWECSVVIVDQLSIIGSLRGVRKKVATVKSVYLPSECTSCAKESEVRVSEDDYRKDPSLLSYLKPCPHCGDRQIFSIPDISGLFD